MLDTNVLVVANGRDTHADVPCQLACCDRIQDTRDKKLVVIDDQEVILGEYQRYARFSGEPGLGDAFFTYIFNHQYDAAKVLRVPITVSQDNSRGFAELPANTLKGGDRAILAAAVAGDAQILNATDSDWIEQHQLLDALDIEVIQLCPQHARRT